jgi:hypothetical protein
MTMDSTISAIKTSRSRAVKLLAEIDKYRGRELARPSGRENARLLAYHSATMQLPRAYAWANEAVQILESALRKAQKVKKPSVEYPLFLQAKKDLAEIYLQGAEFAFLRAMFHLEKLQAKPE